MNILFITTQFGEQYQQGTERYLRLIIGELNQSKNITYNIATGDPLNLFQKELWNKNEEGNYLLPTYNWPVVLGPNEAEIELFFKKVQPNIIHILNLSHLGLNYIKVAKKLGIKIISTFMDFWTICPKGTLMNFNSCVCKGQLPTQTCIHCINSSHSRPLFKALSFLPTSAQNFIHHLKFKELYQSHSEKKSWANRNLILEQFYRDIDHAIFPSRTMEKKITQHHTIKNYSTIPYGLDPSWFKNKKVDSNKKKYFIGFIGSISEHKGLHLIFEGMQKLNMPKVTLKIAGPIISKSYFDNLTKSYPEIEFQYDGMLSGNDLKNFYQSLDLLIVPSLWPENTPFVIYECLALQTPVLASDHESIREQIEDDNFLFNPNDVNDLLDKLKQIINQKLSLKKQTFISSSETMVSKILEIYHS